MTDPINIYESGHPDNQKDNYVVYLEQVIEKLYLALMTHIEDEKRKYENKLRFLENPLAEEWTLEQKKNYYENQLVYTDVKLSNINQVYSDYLNQKKEINHG